MQVVEHEDRRAVGAVEGLADVAGGPVGERRRGARTAREVDPDLLQRRGQVAPQAGDVDVLGAQGEPSRAARGGPAGEQHRLPRARGPGHRRSARGAPRGRARPRGARAGPSRTAARARRGEGRPRTPRGAPSARCAPRGERVIPRGSASMALTGVSRGWRTPISGRAGTNLKTDDRGRGGCEGSPRQTRHRRRRRPPSVWRLERPLVVLAEVQEHRRDAPADDLLVGEPERRKIAPTCFSTARLDSTSVSAIAALLLPWAISASTSRSRGGELRRAASRRAPARAHRARAPSPGR